MSEPVDNSQQTLAQRWWRPTTHKISAATLAGGLIGGLGWVAETFFHTPVPALVIGLLTGTATQLISAALPDAWEAD